MEMPNAILERRSWAPVCPTATESRLLDAPGADASTSSPLRMLRARSMAWRAISGVEGHEVRWLFKRCARAGLLLGPFALWL